MSSGYNPERALHAFFAQQQVPQATQQQQDWWWKHQNDTNLIQLNTLRKNAHKFPQQLSPRSKHLAPLAKSPRSPRSPRVPHSTLPIPGLVLVPPGSPRGPRPDYQPPSFRMATPSQRNKPNVGALPPIQADADAVAEEDDGLTEEGRKILAEAKAAEEAKKKKEMQYLISQVEENIYKRNVGGGDMFRQFQKMDLDRSGRLNRAEIKHALNVSFNMLVDDEKLDLLMANLDLDGDGGVSYEEFTDKLVRETVAPAAMGKRGLQSKEAMGVDAQAWLNKQLGHGAAPKNEKFKGDKELQGVGVEIEGITAKSVREAHTAIVRKLLDKFGSARKIFLTVDEDRDNFISKEEFTTCLQNLNCYHEIGASNVDGVMQLIDVNQDQQFDYRELVRFMKSSDALNMDNSGLTPRKAVKQPRNIAANRGHGYVTNASQGMQLQN